MNTGDRNDAPLDQGFQPEPSSVERLEDDECWELLAEARFGRLAVAAAGDIDIFPVNFVVRGHEVVIRTAEGTKLLEAVISDLVAIETDHRDPETGVAWSVVAKGEPEMLERFDDIYAAQRLDIRPWIRDLPKEHFIRVLVHTISGRRLRSSGRTLEDL
jgi:nitroimidazol reductase NimA-like FMN-containing flavoprotein (pyridoxamine 5'-phosphate oxidase superfamily)